MNGAWTYGSRAQAAATLLLVVIHAGCADGRFGKQSTVHEDMYKSKLTEIPAWCGEDGDCMQGLRCCAGQCLQCCMDSQCGAADSTEQLICHRGGCLREEAFRWPLAGAVLTPPAGMNRFSVDEGLLAAGAGEWVWLFDLAFNPPDLASSLYLDGPVRDLVLHEGILYVLTRSEREAEDKIHLVDVSNPSKPRWLIGLGTEVIDSFAVEGTFLWVLSRSIVYLINIMVAAGPDLVSYRALPCETREISVDRGIMPLACGEAGLFMVDAENPLSPGLARLHVPGLEAARGVKAAGGAWALLGDFDDGKGGTEKRLLIMDRQEEGPPVAYPAAGLVDFRFDGRNLLVERGDGARDLYAVGPEDAAPAPQEAAAEAVSGGCVISRRGSGDLSVACGGREEASKIPSGKCAAFSDADMRGEWGVVGCREGGLLILNGSVPAFPPALDFLVLERGVRKTVLLQSLLMVVDESSVLSLYGLSRTGEGSLAEFDYAAVFGAAVTDAAYTGEAGGVAVVDDASTLRILNASPTGIFPETSGEIKLKSEPLAVRVDASSSQDHVFVQVLEKGWVEVFDARDPAGLEPEARFETVGAQALAGWGTETFIAGKGGLHRGTAKGSLTPVPEAGFCAEDVFDLLYDGSIVTAAGKTGTWLFSVQGDAGTPELRHALPGAGGKAFKMLSHQGNLLLAGEDAIRIFRLSPPPMSWAGLVRFLGKGGGKAELGEEEAGFPAGPILGVKTEGEKSWFAAPGKGKVLYLYESSPAGLMLAAAPAAAHDVDHLRKGSGHRLTSFSDGGGVQVFDLSEPGHPVKAAEIATGAAVADAAAAKRGICLRLEGGALAVADMDDPGAGLIHVEGLGPVGDYPLQAEALRCWGVDESGGAFGVNLVDRTAPVVETYLPAALAGRILGLLRAGPYLLLATNRRVVVVDASGAGVLEILGSVEIMETGVDGMAVLGDRVMVYGWNGEMTAFQVLDISEPGEPGFLGSYDMPFRVLHVQTAGEKLLVTFEAAGRPVFAWLALPPVKPKPL
jgi:hypothetical protein